MAAGEIATLSGTIIKIASTIQQTGNNWYRASADWTDFPRKVANLQRQHDFWEAKLTQYGMLSDTSLIEILSEAKALLEKEQAKLSRREARCGAGLWQKVGMTMFPAKIGLTMQQAIEGFDAILGQLEKENAVDTVLETRVMGEAPAFIIPNDDRYVPFVTTEKAIYSALDDRDGPSIVLLYGSSGKGKSTLARHAVIRYQQTPHSTLFERVVFLECGPEADPSPKQFDLLQLLGSTTGASEEQGQRETNPDVAIRKRLSRLLKDQKILIILDDVSKEEFLKCMVELCGAGVKCLVTSQRGDLCRRLSFPFTTIQIEDVNEEVAMEILASHVGFKDKLVPGQIKGVAQQMVKRTEGHPLALASIATAIDEKRSDELEEWEAAAQNFLYLLHSEDTAYIHGKKYPKSFWSAMKLSVKSLKEDAQKLLILVHMCAGPSVPEEVLRVLYLSVIFQGSSETFEKARKDLESRELIKITNFKKYRSWSVHSLQKVFIEEVMRDLKESMFTLLAPKTNESGVESKIITEFWRGEDAMVQIILCALYFEEHFAHRVVSNMGIPPGSLSDLRRNAIEPITRLLGRPVSQQWKSDAQSSAKQIFVKYICNDALHCEGILHLLELPISILPMLSALEGVATIDRTGLLDPNSQGLIKALLDLIEDRGTWDSSIAKAATDTLYWLVSNNLHFKIIISSGIWEAIVRILSSEPSTDLQVVFIRVLAHLSCASAESRCTKILVETPGSLALLVKSLFNANDASLQCLLALALGNLSNGEVETLLGIINSPRPLEELVKLLSLENNPTLHVEQLGHKYYAARILRNLCGGMLFMEPAAMEYVKEKFNETKGLIDGLLGLLNDQIPASTQIEAIQALTYLDPVRGNAASLRSAEAYSRRGHANIVLGLNKESVQDLNEACKIEAADPRTLRLRIYAKVRLGDFQGALADANTVVEIDQSPLSFEKRGVVKRIMGDLPGALADLDKGLDLEPDAYELLKHRGYVRFLMNDEKGARSDAEMALRIKRSLGDEPQYRLNCSRTTSVEFLDYKLK